MLCRADHADDNTNYDADDAENDDTLHDFFLPHLSARHPFRADRAALHSPLKKDGCGTNKNDIWHSPFVILLRIAGVPGEGHVRGSKHEKKNTVCVTQPIQVWKTFKNSAFYGKAWE